LDLLTSNPIVLSHRKWPYKSYQDRQRAEEKIEKSDILRQTVERCADQVKNMEIKTDTKKSVADKYIHGMFDPIYQTTKKKFKFTDDECLQAFEDAVDLLKIKMVMGS
jgi:hypothetical protein